MCSIIEVMDADVRVRTKPWQVKVGNLPGAQINVNPSMDM